MQTKIQKYFLLAFLVLIIILFPYPTNTKYENLYPVTYGLKTGFINKTGELVIFPKFNEVNNFSEGLAGVNINQKWSFVDNIGKLITKPAFDGVRNFSSGLAAVKVKDKWSFIDRKGKFIIQPSFDEVRNFSEDIAAVKVGSKWGLINKKGNFIIQPSLNNAPYLSFYKGFAPVNISNATIWLDKTGKIFASPPSYDPSYSSVLLFPTQINGKCQYMRGATPVSEKFDECGYFSDYSEGLAPIVSSGKLGFIDSTGKIIIKPQFPIDKNTSLFSRYFSNDLAPIKINGKCGYINKQGKFAIQPKYDFCTSFDEQGIATVSTSDKKDRYINKDGKSIGKRYISTNKELYSSKLRWQTVFLSSIFVCIGWLLSVSAHEFGHAIVAYWGGDDSVKDKGYLTLNPLKYCHPLTSIILPIIFLIIGGIPLPGAAVYIEKHQLRNRRWQSAVSAAGPAASFFVALLLLIPFYFHFQWSGARWLASGLAFLIVLQFDLVLFNLLPIPPLDGYGIIEPWLPNKIQAQLRKFSLIGLIFAFILAVLILPFLLELIFGNFSKLNILLLMVGDGYRLLNKWFMVGLGAAVGVITIILHPQKFWYFIANILSQFKKYEKATFAYDQAIKIKPNYYEAWYRRGWVLEQLERNEEALASYERVTKIQPEYDWAWFRQGWLLAFSLKRSEEAIALYNQALKIKPQNYQAWWNGGLALGALSQYEEAIAAYDGAIKIKPDCYSAWEGRGRMLRYLRRYEEAIAAYDRAIQIEPKSSLAWQNRGLALKELGRYEEALASYQKATQVQPDNNEAWYEQGKMLSDSLQRYEEAIAAYDQAIQSKSKLYTWTEYNAWNGRGWALYNLQRYEEAIAAYDKAIQIEPKKYLAWHNKGVAFQALQQHEDALNSYDKALEIQPRHHYAWYGWFGKGWALANLQKYEEAIASFNKAIKLQPDYYHAWFYQGCALNMLQRYDDAIASFNQAFEIEPENPYLWYNRACSYAGQGNINLAIESLQKAINLGGDSFRESAKANASFNSIREHELFKQLIGNSQQL